VGVKVACLDFVENIDDMRSEDEAAHRVKILRQLGARMVDRSVWDTIADSQPPKQIVDKRIILPLTNRELAEKHGVVPPRAIIFFGPPGTGKTHFVRAIAGALQWWYVEISPSSLMCDGADRVSAHLKLLMEQLGDLDEVVLFIDEFEEIAGDRSSASRVDKSITNEFLKQVPLLKRREGKILLACATNYIRELDGALLRPGRFDCIIPVGALDDPGRRTVFEHYLASTNRGDVDVDLIIGKIPYFTPADIEYMFQKVTHLAFERELALGDDYKLTTESFLEALPKVRPSLSPEIIEEFQAECKEFTRV
jgi:SpoVK/Ycf46/Vps4 family AAA+-type ATPase